MMDGATTSRIEELFTSLVPEEKARVISHGVALRLSDLRKRLQLARSRVQHFEETYGISLEQLEAEGLPDDAGYEMHEDYVMWQHWAEVVGQVEGRIADLEEIADEGLYVGEILRAGD
jgi:hypothetical protein